MEKEKIAILGAGHGAHAFAGYLALKGFDVSIVGIPEEESRIKPIRKRGGIEVSGIVSGFGKIAPENATVSVEEGIKGRKIIFVVVPAFGHEYFAKELAKSVEDGQIICICPDNFGTLEFARVMKERNVKKDIKLAGTESLLFACRKGNGPKVNIFGVKKEMPVAALPATDTEYVVEKLKELSPAFVPAKNVLEVGFNNINMIVHCAAAILNAGWIEWTKGNFMFYWQGMTKSVCRVMEKEDEERIAVGRRYGLELPSTLENMIKFYGKEVASREPKTLYDFVSTSKVHGGRGPDAPKDLRHRYISEDVPYGLVPVSSFGKLAGVRTPAIDSIITLASIMNETDYFEEGRNLKRLGLLGKSPEEIIKFIEGGEYK